MPPKQEDNPNLNRGGNEGNVYGAGAPRRAFRVAAAKAAERQLKHWIDVAAGLKVITVPGFGNKADTKRKPTHDEQERAYKDILLRFGIGTQDEVVVLQSTEILDALAEVLPEFVEDADLVDRILAALESRVGGQAQ